MNKTDLVLRIWQKMDVIKSHWYLLKRRELFLPEDLSIFTCDVLNECLDWLKVFEKEYNKMVRARNYIPIAAWETYESDPTTYCKHRDYAECKIAIKVCRKILAERPKIFTKGYQNAVQKRHGKNNKKHGGSTKATG